MRHGQDYTLAKQYLQLAKVVVSVQKNTSMTKTTKSAEVALERNDPSGATVTLDSLKPLKLAQLQSKPPPSVFHFRLFK